MAAIYQWFTSDEIILTTTLYPLEAEDSLSLSCYFQGGEYWQIAQSDGLIDQVTPLGGTLNNLLVELPPIDNYGLVDQVDIVSGELISYLVDINANENYGLIDSVQLLSGVLQYNLIEADSPDEKIDFSCAIYSDPTYCYVEVI